MVVAHHLYAGAIDFELTFISMLHCKNAFISKAAVDHLRGRLILVDKDHHIKYTQPQQLTQ